jgi:GNAT superfamily N-acetyltransferase
MVPSAEIVSRVVQAECLATVSRLGVLERLAGNPVGVERMRLGEAFALSARYLPNSSFNRVVGLTDAQAGEVPRLIDWFERRKIAGRFEIAPGIDCPAVMRALAAAGYGHSGFHAVLFGEPRAAPEPPPEVSVEVVTAETLETFLDTYSAGWEIPDPEGFKANVRGWLGQPGWTLYLGRHRGEPAGGAILFMHERTGYCADSAVRPDRRGHGVHQALLARRLADAGAAGADLACAQAAFLSTSHRNMVRSGLALLSVKAIWTRTASAAPL